VSSVAVGVGVSINRRHSGIFQAAGFNSHQDCLQIETFAFTKDRPLRMQRTLGFICGEACVKL
jgi:hypothetical protein